MAAGSSIAVGRGCYSHAATTEDPSGDTDSGVGAGLAAAVERQGEHRVQQHREAAGTSGVAAAYRMPSGRMAAQVAALQTAAAAAAEAEAAQCGKLTAFFKP